MMSSRLRLIHKNQRGLTLVELLIAIVLAGIVTSGITITIGHMFTWTTRTNNHMIAVRQVQSAGYWVSRDALQASTVIHSPSGGELLILGWSNPDNLPIEVVYSIEGGRLRRSEAFDGSTTSTYVAQHIDPAGTSFDRDPDGSRAYIFEVTATVGATSVYKATETREYRVDPRPDA